MFVGDALGMYWDALIAVPEKVSCSWGIAWCPMADDTKSAFANH